MVVRLNGSATVLAIIVDFGLSLGGLYVDAGMGVAWNTTFSSLV